MVPKPSFLTVCQHLAIAALIPGVKGVHFRNHFLPGPYIATEATVNVGAQLPTVLKMFAKVGRQENKPARLIYIPFINMQPRSP